MNTAKQCALNGCSETATHEGTVSGQNIRLTDAAGIVMPMSDEAVVTITDWFCDEHGHPAST